MLVRKIEQDDIPKIEFLIEKTRNDSKIKKIERLGGMTNHSYKVTLHDDEELLVRIPGEGTEDMINRSDERKSTMLACKLGVDTDLYYFDDTGYKVMRFIHNPQPINEEVMRRKENIIQAAELFHRLHYSQENTGVRFEVFEMASLYENLIHKDKVVLYDDYEIIKNEVISIKKEVDKNGESPKVPCHNDSLMGNWVLDEKGKLYLIDWEYSGMNEPMWDLSCLSIEANYTEENDRDLLYAYYGRTADTEERKRFTAAKLYVDYLWTLWGLARVPYEGKFMQEYADERYKRLKKNIKAYQNIK